MQLSATLDLAADRALAPPARAVELPGAQLRSGAYEEIAAWLVARARSRPAVIAAHVNLANYHALRHWPAGLARCGELELLFGGIGLKLAAWVLGQGWLPELNGSDLFPHVMRRAAAEGLRVFFLGSTREVVEGAAEEACRDYPGLALVGARDGFFPLDDCDAVVAEVCSARPDLLVVGMGFPRQEAFALAQRDRLGVGAIWTAGGLFDFVSGAKPRAPSWLRRLRLEWLFRLGLEPVRMWRRNTIPPLWLAGQVLRARLGRARGAQGPRSS